MNTQRIIEHYYSHAVNFKLPGIFSSTVTFLLSLGFKSELNALNFMVHFFLSKIRKINIFVVGFF